MNYEYLFIIVFIVGYTIMTVASYFDDNNKTGE